MNNPKFPRPLTPQQLARLRAFIYADPLMTHQEFVAKWCVKRELVAEICHVDIRTCNSWFGRGCTHQEPQLYHLWYLTMADIILDYEDLAESLQTVLSPDDF
ncbi:MAG: hypothetical protein ACYT04_24260 [Nostoc sp.]